MIIFLALKVEGYIYLSFVWHYSATWVQGVWLKEWIITCPVSQLVKNFTVYMLFTSI